MSNKLFAYNIKYDCDREEKKTLPKKVRIPNRLSGDDDAIADFISDKTGYCVFGFCLTKD